MGFLEKYHLLGLPIGLSTFLVIGLFHPLVIRAEYYLGTKSWWLFLVGGLAAMAASVAVDNTLLSALLGVTAFSCFWSILEVFQQQERVRKGWFPRNPHRKYPFDNKPDENE